MAGLLSFFKCTPDARRALEAHRVRLYRVAYAWTHQPALADDLVQETLTKALVKCSQLRDPQAGEAWLYTILANCYRDHFRRSRDTDDVDEHELADEARTPEEASGALDITTKVRAAIARLPEGQRQVVTLVDLEGFSYIEVARILDVPIGTVMSRLCRARTALKELLAHLRSGGESDNNTNGASAHLRRVK
jgi:RNA polymerase sigma-70 factor (ECF subfamily)